MSKELEILIAWAWWITSWFSLGAVLYECLVPSERHAKRIEGGLPPYKNEYGQLYLDFMKDYV